MSPKKILLICFDNIGDLVFSSALFPPLRAAFPDAHLGVWCKRYTASLAPLIPHVSTVFSSDPFWDRSPGHGKGSLTAFARTTFQVRAAAFDCAIIPSLRWQAAAAARVAGIPLCIGMEGRRNRRWLTSCLPARDRSQPVMTDIARLLHPLGIEAMPLCYALDSDALPHTNVNRSDGLKVVLHPFASKRGRCVAQDVWVGFAAMLRDSGWRITWFGTRPELEQLDAYSGLRERDTFLDAGADLLAGAAVIHSARVFVGHDSGPLHMAAALGIPTVGVFAPGEPARTFPQGRAPHVLVSVDTPSAVDTSDLMNAFINLIALVDEHA